MRRTIQLDCKEIYNCTNYMDCRLKYNILFVVGSSEKSAGQQDVARLSQLARQVQPTLAESSARTASWHWRFFRLLSVFKRIHGGFISVDSPTRSAIDQP